MCHRYLSIGILVYLALNTENMIATATNGEFLCPKDGRWPSPTDCEKYYTCNSGISVQGWCGGGMTYDVEHQRCDLSKNIDCKDGERSNWTPPEGWQSDAVTSNIVTKTTPDPYKEKDDVEQSKTRSPKKRKTTVRITATTSTRAVRIRTTLSLADLVGNTECTFQGNMPDPDNCQSYYTCKEETITYVHCPDKHLFDEDLRMCNDYRKVFCSNRPTNEHGGDPCIGQPNGWYADAESQCRSYHLCTEQRKIKMGDCPTGTKWNSQRLRCDDPRNIAAPCGLRSNIGVSLLYQSQSSTIIFVLLLLLTFQQVFSRYVQ